MYKFREKNGETLAVKGVAAAADAHQPADVGDDDAEMRFGADTISPDIMVRYTRRWRTTVLIFSEREAFKSLISKQVSSIFIVGHINFCRNQSD